MGIAALITTPHATMADDKTFNTDFESALSDIVANGTGTNSLTFNGIVGHVSSFDTTLTAPGSNDALTINFRASSLNIGKASDGSLTLGSGTTLNLGMSGGDADLLLGSGSATGALHVDGGRVNLGADPNGDANKFDVGHGAGHTGVLRVTNGGVINMGMEEDAASYSRFHVGRGSGARGTVELDNGRINIGPAGASIRIGVDGGAADMTLSNGSILDSSRGRSNFWVGDGVGANGTVTVDNSTVLNIGTPQSGLKESYFEIGKRGGTGVMTQLGADSVVHVSGMTFAGLGRGTGSTGTYNLEGGLLEIGSSDSAKPDHFRIAMDSDTTGTLNISGGTAKIWGELQIANATDATGTVNVTGGKLEVVGGIRFGNGTGTLTVAGGLVDAGAKIIFGSGANVVNVVNLNGGVLAMQGDGVTGTGEVNFDGGTLQAKDDLTFAHGANIESGGAILDSNGNTLTYSGNLSGPGGIEKTGAGTLVLSGDNIYSGGTTITEGTLDAASTTALGDEDGAVTLDGGTLKLTSIDDLVHDLVADENGGTLDLTGPDKTFSGNGTGTGNVTIQDGKLLLDGYLSWTGETIVDNATLAMGGDNRLSSSSLLRIELDGTVEIGGSTQTVDRIAGEGEILINGGTFAIGGESASSSFAGDFNGAAGTIRKTGTGTFDFTGDGDFAGEVQVEGGLWAMNGALDDADFSIGSNGRLEGIGTIGSLAAMSGNSGGNVAPGHSIGTMNVAGNVDFDGLVYEVEINDQGQSDRIDATGSIALDGGTLNVLPEPGEYDPTISYTILTAGNGITGSFDTVNDDFAFLDAVVSFDDVLNPSKVLMNLERNQVAFSDEAHTGNQAATADALDTMTFGDPVYDAILQLNGDGARTAFNALSGEVHASVRTVLAEDSRRIRMAANDRVRMGFDTSSGADFSTPSSGVGAWATVHGNWSKVEGNGNASELDRSTAGFLTGLDGLVGGWQVGALAGYSHSNFDVDALASSGKAKSFHVGAYAGNRWDAIGLRGGLAYSWSNIDTSRTVAFPGFSERLTADYDAGTLQAFGELGYKIEGGSAWIEPFVNLAHVRIHTDGFTEKGGASALNVAGQTSHTTFTTVGVHAAAQFDLGGTAVEARGTLGWQHGFGDLVPMSVHQFAPNATFAVTGAPLAKDAAIIEAGLDFALTPSAKLGVSYGGAFSSDTKEHGGKLGLAVNF